MVLKNKKGFTLIYAMMLGVILFFFGLAIASPLKDVTQSVMGDSALNCSTTDNTWNKAICTEIDLFLPLFVGLLFGLAGFIIGGIVR